MSKVKTDSIEAFTTSGTLSVLSPVAVPGNNPVLIGGSFSVNAGATIDGGASVDTGSLRVRTGAFNIGTPGSETATISNAGAASFASLVMNGQAVTGTAAGGRIHAFGTATKGTTGNGNGTVTGYNVTACTHTATTITVTYPAMSETNKFAIGLPASASQVIEQVNTSGTSVQFTVNADEVTTIFFVVLGG